jgi:hypothetical protein
MSLLISDIIHTVLGVPNDCVFRNVVRPCKLSFSCWMEGGRYVQGCGTNKWLYSCCIIEKERYSSATKLKIVNLPNKNLLRRRSDDDDLLQVYDFD